MNEILENTLALADVDDGKSSARPIYVLEYDGERVRFLALTTQYANKSKQMQKVYFEIRDWQEAGLKKPSYIDVYRPYIISEKRIKISPIGELTDYDETELWKFIEDRAFSM